jgi:soluble lytic murein transglycosylase
MRDLSNPSGGFFAPFLIFMCVVLLPVTGKADIYRYVDKDGVIHFTNVPTEPNYRKVPSLPSLPTYAAKRPAYYGVARGRQSLTCPTGPANQYAYDFHIQLVCQRYSLDRKLVKAVIRAESGYNAQAVSPKGAAGLMQLMPGTSRDLGVLDPFDPYQNIDGGARYLRAMLNRFGNDVILALAAYNAGPESVQKYGGVPPYDETQTYVQRVLDYYSRIP